MSDEVPNFAALITDMFFRPHVDCTLEADADRMVIKHWTCEADFRRQLARLAFVYGWDVREEVVIPGWGRIDIILDDADRPDYPILTELKLELRRPADVRRAYQQADGYGRWWKTTKGQMAEVVLTALDYDKDLVRSVGDAYPEVSFYPTGHYMGLLPQWRVKSTQRWMQARVRLEDARRALGVHELAVANIEQIEKPS
jgi:hypothetical protein